MDRAEKFWDKMADGQDKDIERFRKLSDKIIENSLKYLSKKDKVLDIGCGTGDKAIEVAGHVGHVHGFDISGKAVKIARERALKADVQNVRFSKALLFDDIFEKGSYDVVLAYNIMHALDDDREAMMRISELLKPGGYLLMNTPCLGERMSTILYLQFLPYRLFSRIGIFPLKVRRYRFNEMEDLFCTNGFEILEKEIAFQGMHAYFIAGRKNE
jgi:2-polyprenyl-3-methyl-5-hydroxy-6-metoxy-1,4-benzoquinol methylase